MRAWRVVRGLRRVAMARYPLVADVVLAAVWLIPGGDFLGHQLAVGATLLPLQLALVLPLVWRRRAPLAVFTVMAAVAAHRPAGQALLACGVLELGVLLACLRWVPGPEFLKALIGMSALVVADAAIGVNLRTRRAYLAFLEDRAVRLERERDQQALIAAAGERSRIDREMHDIVTHNLSVMVALADAAVFAQKGDPDKATAVMRQISGTGRHALTEMRRFLGLLRDGEPDARRHPMPGIDQLESLVEQVRRAGRPVQLEVTGAVAGLPAGAGLAVYRIVQEALTNVLKHTPARTSVEVTVRLVRPDPPLHRPQDQGPPVRLRAGPGHRPPDAPPSSPGRDHHLGPRTPGGPGRYRGDRPAQPR
jgi:signal transduction histidine kinase